MWNKVPKREYINGKGYAQKQNPDKIINKGVIYDPMGQWKYPGEVTKIPGNTMATHGYGNIPLWVVPDNDPARLVQPNSGQQLFPNSTNFTEYPQLPIAQRGGVLLPGAQGRWLDSVNAQFNKQYGGDMSDDITPYDAPGGQRYFNQDIMNSQYRRQQNDQEKWLHKFEQ